MHFRIDFNFRAKKISFVITLSGYRTPHTLLKIKNIWIQ